MLREILESKDRMSKEVKAKLSNLDVITTTKRTQSLWYSPSTEYKIDLVDDGYYSKKPGIRTKGGFIPLSDIVVESISESTETNYSEVGRILNQIVALEGELRKVMTKEDYRKIDGDEDFFKFYEKTREIVEKEIPNFKFR